MKGTGGEVHKTAMRIVKVLFALGWQDGQVRYQPASESREEP